MLSLSFYLIQSYIIRIEETMWTKVRHLNHSQKQRITSNLFVAVAVGAILTVAGPTLLPCPAYDQNDRSAFLEDQKAQKSSSNIKKKVIIVKRRRDTKQVVEQDDL